MGCRRTVIAVSLLVLATGGGAIRPARAQPATHPVLVEVPDVRRLAPEDAARRLATGGLGIGRIYDVTVPPTWQLGLVVRQRPPPSTPQAPQLLPWGSTIDLAVSAARIGPTQGRLPPATWPRPAAAPPEASRVPGAPPSDETSSSVPPPPPPPPEPSGQTPPAGGPQAPRAAPSPSSAGAPPPSPRPPGPNPASAEPQGPGAAAAPGSPPAAPETPTGAPSGTQGPEEAAPSEGPAPPVSPASPETPAAAGGTPPKGPSPASASPAPEAPAPSSAPEAPAGPASAGTPGASPTAPSSPPPPTVRPVPGQEHEPVATGSPDAPSSAKPPDPDHVPDLRGLRLSDAEYRASQVDMTLYVERVAGLPVGCVLRQEPAPGSGRPPGNVVKVVVAAGGDRPDAIAPAPEVAVPDIPVPDLLDRTGPQAERILHDMGLVALMRAAPRGPPDRVADQKPAAGTVVAKGSSVEVWVAPPGKTHAEGPPPGPEGPPPAEASPGEPAPATPSAPAPAAGGLAAPVPIAPGAGANIGADRSLTLGFSWRPVEGADAYLVEVEESSDGGWLPNARQASRKTGLVMELQRVASDPGALRWRVRAIARGRQGPASAWVVIR